MDRVVVATAYEIRKKNGLGWNDVEDTIRGLEDYFLVRSKSSVRKAHMYKVLTEQCRQKDLEIQDDDCLGDVARESSYSERMNAARMGDNDALAAAGKYTFRP